MIRGYSKERCSSIQHSAILFETAIGVQLVDCATIGSPFRGQGAHMRPSIFLITEGCNLQLQVPPWLTGSVRAQAAKNFCS